MVRQCLTMDRMRIFKAAASLSALVLFSLSGGLLSGCSADTTDPAGDEDSFDQALTTSTDHPLVIQNGNGGRAPLARSFALRLGADTRSTKGTCGATSSDGRADILGTDPMPASGSAITFTNTSAETVLVRAFEIMDRGGAGADYSNAYPKFAADVDVATSSVVPATMVGTVVELAPGATIAAIVPPVPKAEGGAYTEFRFQCQRLSTFARRPKFSYGWMYSFNSGR